MYKQISMGQEETNKYKLGNFDGATPKITYGDFYKNVQSTNGQSRFSPVYEIVFLAERTKAGADKVINGFISDYSQNENELKDLQLPEKYQKMLKMDDVNGISKAIHYDIGSGKFFGYNLPLAATEIRQGNFEKTEKHYNNIPWNQEQAQAAITLGKSRDDWLKQASDDYSLAVETENRKRYVEEKHKHLGVDSKNMNFDKNGAYEKYKVEAYGIPTAYNQVMAEARSDSQREEFESKKAALAKKYGFTEQDINQTLDRIHAAGGQINIYGSIVPQKIEKEAQSEFNSVAVERYGNNQRFFITKGYMPEGLAESLHRNEVNQLQREEIVNNFEKYYDPKTKTIEFAGTKQPVINNEAAKLQGITPAPFGLYEKADQNHYEKTGQLTYNYPDYKDIKKTAEKESPKPNIEPATAVTEKEVSHSAQPKNNSGNVKAIKVPGMFYDSQHPNEGYSAPINGKTKTIIDMNGKPTEHYQEYIDANKNNPDFKPFTIEKKTKSPESAEKTNDPKPVQNHLEEKTTGAPKMEIPKDMLKGFAKVTGGEDKSHAAPLNPTAVTANKQANVAEAYDPTQTTKPVISSGEHVSNASAGKLSSPAPVNAPAPSQGTSIKK